MKFAAYVRDAEVPGFKAKLRMDGIDPPFCHVGRDGRLRRGLLRLIPGERKAGKHESQKQQGKKMALPGEPSWILKSIRCNK